MEDEAKPLIEYYNLLQVNSSSIKYFPQLERKMFGNSFNRITDVIRIYMNGYESNVAVVVTGVGKVNAAASVSYAISVLNPIEVINIGMCGSLNPNLHKRGYICNVKTVFQHDMFIPITGPDFDHLMDKINLQLPQSKTVVIDESEYNQVILATGDSFIEDEDLKMELSQIADIVDMEGFSIARVCEMFNVKLRIYKIVSDSSDQNAVLEFNDSLGLYTEKVKELLLRI